MELENLPQEKIKQELIKNILKQFSYKVVETDINKNMSDFRGFHYKINITNKETKKYRSFNFSVGSGWNSEQRTDLNLFLNCLNSLYMDMPYIDKEELKSIYSDGTNINKIHKAVLKNYDKMQTIGLNIFFDELNETEQEILNEGF